MIYHSKKKFSFWHQKLSGFITLDPNTRNWDFYKISWGIFGKFFGLINSRYPFPGINPLFSIRIFGPDRKFWKFWNSEWKIFAKMISAISKSYLIIWTYIPRKWLRKLHNRLQTVKIGQIRGFDGPVWSRPWTSNLKTLQNVKIVTSAKIRFSKQVEISKYFPRFWRVEPLTLDENVRNFGKLKP